MIHSKSNSYNITHGSPKSNNIKFINILLSLILIILGSISIYLSIINNDLNCYKNMNIINFLIYIF